MKRSVIIIAHILAVVLALAGFVAMREYTIDGRGLSWINTQSFDDSVRFSDMVSDDIQAIKRYAVLKAAFEDDDELNTEKLIVSGTTVNGNIAYTAADIINVGKSFGYNLNPSTYELSYSRVQNEPNNYQIRVNYKLYDPYYFDNIEPGPSQGVTTVRDMCVEALRAVSEYYRLKSVYDVQESNFRFNAFFESRDGEEITVGNTDSEPVNINNYGKYLTVSYALDVNTNISPAPSNLVQDSNTFGYANTEGNVLEIGVDKLSETFAEAEEDNAALAVIFGDLPMNKGFEDVYDDIFDDDELDDYTGEHINSRGNKSEDNYEDDADTDTDDADMPGDHDVVLLDINQFRK